VRKRNIEDRKSALKSSRMPLVSTVCCSLALRCRRVTETRPVAPPELITKLDDSTGDPPMESIRTRAIDQFPTVLITLLSIVQALALEFLWDHLHHRPDLYVLSLESLLGWMQITASLVGLILIWLSYASMVMRFRWVPSTLDSMLPFFIGLIQFLMIDLMGPDRLGQWLLVLAVVFATMILGSHHVFRRARMEKSNSEFFDRYAPAVARDFLPHTAVIVFLVLSGGWLCISDVGMSIKLPIIATALVILLLEIRNAARFWNESMGSQ